MSVELQHLVTQFFLIWQKAIGKMWAKMFHYCEKKKCEHKKEHRFCSRESIQKSNEIIHVLKNGMVRHFRNDEMTARNLVSCYLLQLLQSKNHNTLASSNRLSLINRIDCLVCPSSFMSYCWKLTSESANPCNFFAFKTIPKMLQKREMLLFAWAFSFYGVLCVDSF